MTQTTGKSVDAQDVASHPDVPRVVGDSSPMRQLRSMIETIAPRESTVLVQGESGSGKELVARQIHAHSRRRNKPFVAVDCTILRDTLIESELFGHNKGAFTGADKSTIGFIRAADGGTLFLDEIGDLAAPVQAKLLRCIQERAVIPVGSTDPIPVNVRIVAATHRNLKDMVRDGDFRQDLFYRLNVVALKVPALRERRKDIARLAEHFLAELSHLYEEPAKLLSDDLVTALETYDWPGNVRELTNAIEHAYVLSDNDTLTVDDLPEDICTAVKAVALPAGSKIPTLAIAERALIVRALHESKGNQALAARMLDVERHRFYRMVKRHDLTTMTQD